MVFDGAFAVVALVFAVLDPTGAETWTRWGVVVLADASLVMGALKAVGLRRPRIAARLAG